MALHKLSVSASFCFPKPGLFPMPGLPPCGINHNRKQGAGCPTQPTCLLQISRRCQGVWSLPCLPVAEAFPSASGLSGRSSKSSNYVQGSLGSNASKHPRAETMGGAGSGSWVRAEAQEGERAYPRAPHVLDSGARCHLPALGCWESPDSCPWGRPVLPARLPSARTYPTLEPL